MNKRLRFYNLRVFQSVLQENRSQFELKRSFTRFKLFPYRLNRYWGILMRNNNYVLIINYLLKLKNPNILEKTPLYSLRKLLRSRSITLNARVV